MGALADSTPDELRKMGAATTDKQTEYKAMDDSDIQQLILDWADAAERIAKAGCDAIEIYAAHRYIPMRWFRQGAHPSSRKNVHTSKMPPPPRTPMQRPAKKYLLKRTGCN